MSRLRSPEAFLALILMFSAAVRLVFFRQLAATDLVSVPILDSQAYHDWAVQLVTGHPGWGESYWMGPLYPHLLALVYLLFGIGGMAISGWQLLLSLVNIFLVYRLGRDLLPQDPWAPVLAAGHYAGYGAPVFYAGVILMATLVTTLYLLIARQAWAAWHRNTTRAWVGLGLLVGLGGLARGNILLLLATLPILVFRRNPDPGSRLKKSVALVLAGVLMLVPTTLRNLIVADDFVVLTSNGGINLLVGQKVDYKGIFAPVVDQGQADFDVTMEKTLEQEVGRDLKGSEVSRILVHRAWDEIRSHWSAMPLHYLRKAYRFWNGYELPQIFSYDYWRQQLSALRLLVIPYVFLVAFGLLGLPFLKRGPRWVIALMVLTYFLSIWPFFPTSRYRMPLAPLLAIGAAVFLRAQSSLAPSRRRSWLVAAVLLTLFLLPRWARLDPGEVRWQVHLHEASRASKRGDLKTTLAQARLAEETRPDLADTPFQLAVYLEQMKAWPQSEAALRLAATRAPENRLVPYRLGIVLAHQGRWDEAIEAFQQAADLDPQWALPPLRIGLTLRQAGKLPEAVKALEKALDLNPGNRQIRSNLASAYATTGHPERARDLLKQLVRDYPNYLNGWFNLALVESRMDRTEEANQALDRAAGLHGLTTNQQEQIAQLRELMANQGPATR